MNVLLLLNVVLFSVVSDGWLYLAQGALCVVAYWFLFAKCGQESWKALIPVYREYALAQCADREMEGRVLFNLMSAYTLLGLTTLFPIPVEWQAPILFTLSVLEIINIIFSARIAWGLTENFSISKLWLFPIAIIPCLPYLLFAFLPRYQPQWKVPEIDKNDKEFFKGSHAEALGNGLTVNIEKRTTRDFLKTKYLLRDVHMYIKPGSMVLLLGGSGAGKTTLLNAINGYEKADAEILLDNTNVYKEYKKMMYEIGFVPQQDLIRGSDTVFRTLADAATLRLPQNFDRAERMERVDEVMKIFGLAPVKNSMVDKLSGGQRKRLSIAMEFLSNPTLFILDEPDSGLDGVMARELMQQLRMIADQGKIVIVITHTPDRVIDLFDDVIVLAKDANRTGRLAYYGPIDEARTFFGKNSMEQIVKSINRQEEGGEGRADEFINRFAEVQHG